MNNIILTAHSQLYWILLHDSQKILTEETVY